VETRPSSPVMEESEKTFSTEVKKAHHREKPLTKTTPQRNKSALGERHPTHKDPPKREKQRRKNSKQEHMRKEPYLQKAIGES